MAKKLDLKGIRTKLETNYGAVVFLRHEYIDERLFLGSLLNIKQNAYFKELVDKDRKQAEFIRLIFIDLIIESKLIN